MLHLLFVLAAFMFSNDVAQAAPHAAQTNVPPNIQRRAKTNIPIAIGGGEQLQAGEPQQRLQDSTLPIFDIPITYNDRVQYWIRYYQTTGRTSFQKWLSRSTRYSPYIQNELGKAGLPRDIIYTAMIESGFSPGAQSTASAMGIWQFIKPTGERYGLKVNWWLDERKNFVKSTQAAIRYKKDLYGMFGSWYLVAASYNCGEQKIVNLMKKYRTRNFWEMAQLGVLPKETTDYVPKIIAATLIAKAPGLYGFRNIDYLVPYEFETAYVPGGTDLINLATYLGVSPAYLKELNPDLLLGFIPPNIEGHTIKIPKGSTKLVSQYSGLVGGHKKL
jgi:membrane-bound lytic murein transglycosylase D